MVAGFRLLFLLSLAIAAPRSGFQTQELEYIKPRSGFISAIVGGHLSENRPFFANVRMTTGQLYHFCGGTIIDPEWVLTAAHCIHEYPIERVHILMGNFTETFSLKRWMQPTKLVMHPRFQIGRLISNDLALLKLATPIASPSLILPLCAQEEKTGTLLGAAGLGLTIANKQNSASKVLKETYFYEAQMSPLFCRRENVCPSKFSPRDNVCFGDSGGPLYTFDSDKKPKCLYGVTSFLRSSIRNIFYPVCYQSPYFSKIPYFLDWIQKIMQDNQS